MSKEKPSYSGVTNDELEMCAGCDYRLGWDELKDELATANENNKKLQEWKDETLFYTQGVGGNKEKWQLEIEELSDRLENLRTNSAKNLNYYVDKCVILNEKLESVTKAIEFYSKLEHIPNKAHQWLEENRQNPANTPQNVDNSGEIDEIAVNKKKEG